MKKLFFVLLILCLYTSSGLYAQGSLPPGAPAASIATVTYPQMSPGQIDSIKKSAVNAIFSNPQLYNDAFALFANSLKSKPNTLYTFMRDMNIKFKTFQVDNQSPALGFQYQYNNSWTKNKLTPTKSIVQSYNINLSGNIAFKKAANPTNLMETGFIYNGTFIWGGIAKKNDTATAKRLIQISRLIAQNTIPNNPAVAKLYEEQNQLVKITNQYYLGLNVQANYENTQDFSKKQFVPGLLINAGAKAWDKTEALQYFNLPDYPFALLRLITGTDNEFRLSGASFPSALAGIDYVIPQQDSLRQAVTGGLDPFSRFRFEASFKTKAAQVFNKPIYFSCDFRWYRELFATSAELSAGLASQAYFLATLESNNGFFVSYSAGRLPFDKKDANVYGLGFHYNFGNWQ